MYSLASFPGLTKIYLAAEEIVFSVVVRYNLGGDLGTSYCRNDLLNLCQCKLSGIHVYVPTGNE